MRICESAPAIWLGRAFACALTPICPLIEHFGCTPLGASEVDVPPAFRTFLKTGLADPMNSHGKGRIDRIHAWEKPPGQGFAVFS